MFKIFKKVGDIVNNISNSVSFFFNKIVEKLFDLLMAKKSIATILGLAWTMFSMAQSKGAAGFTSAATEISSYMKPVQTLLYAIAGVVSLVGAFNIYFKMQNGDQDVKKTIMMTVGGCVAFIAAATALPAFFK